MALSTDQWITIGASILGSTLITGIVAFIQARNITNLQHKLEYRKIIIQKRLDAYEALEVFVNQLNHMVNLDGVFIQGTLASKAHLDGLNLAILNASLNSFWLNRPTEDKFDEMKLLFAKISMVPRLQDELVIDFAKTNCKSISKYRLQLYQLIKDDYSDLYNLDNIKKKKMKYEIREVSAHETIQ
jgi:hypothetical protein